MTQSTRNRIVLAAPGDPHTTLCRPSALYRRPRRRRRRRQRRRAARPGARLDGGLARLAARQHAQLELEDRKAPGLAAGLDYLVLTGPARRRGCREELGQSKFLVVSLVGERRLQARRRCTRPPHQLPKRPPCSCKLCGHGDQGFGPSQGFQTGTKFTCATQEGEVRASLREVECTVNGQGLSGKNGSTWVGVVCGSVTYFGVNSHFFAPTQQTGRYAPGPM